MQQDERKASRTRSPRGKTPSGRMFRLPCKDFFKGTCTNWFCEKWHPPESLFYKTKSGCRFGEKCLYAHRQVDEQPSKRSKKNDYKSAVAMLKKHELYDRTGETRCLPWHTSRAPRTCCVQLIKYTTIGLRLSGYGAAEVFINFTEELRHAETNPTCKIHESCCTSRKNRGQNPSLGMISQVNLISVAPTVQKLRIGLRRRQSGKSKVPAKQRGSWPKVY